jgi:multiple sugar transport system substrate-binding protein
MVHHPPAVGAGHGAVRATRRSCLFGSALLLCAGALEAACGPFGGSRPAAEPTPGAALQPATLHYFSWGSQPRIEAEQKSIVRFAQDNPKLRVDLEGVPYGEFHTKLRTTLAAGTPPDVTRIAYQQAQGFFANGDMLVLEAYLKRDRLDLDKTQVPPFEGSKYRGRFFGLPRGGAGNIAIVYNKTYFQQKGVPAPTDHWSWDDFIATGKRLSDEAAGVWAWNANALRNEDQWWSWLWSGGADYLNADGTACTLDTSEAIDAIQWMADLQSRHRIAATPDAATGMKLDFVTLRNLVITQTGPYAIVDYNKAIGGAFDWAAVVVPLGKAGQVMNSNPNTVSIPKASGYPEPAWVLMKYFIGDKAQQLEDQLGLWQPTSKALVSAPAYLKRDEPPYDMRPFIPGLQGKTRAPVQIPQMGEVLNTVFKGLEPVVVGQQSARDVLPGLTKQVNELLKKPL